MDRLLRAVCRRLIRTGNLKVTTAAGSTFSCGDGAGTPVAIRFASQAAEWRVLFNPELRLGEAYMDGGFVIEQGSIAEFLDLVVRNLSRTSPTPLTRPLRTLRALARRLFDYNRAPSAAIPTDRPRCHGRAPARGRSSSQTPSPVPCF